MPCSAFGKAGSSLGTVAKALVGGREEFEDSSTTVSSWA